MFGFMFLQGKIDDTGYNYIEHNGLKIYYRDEKPSYYQEVDRELFCSSLEYLLDVKKKIVNEFPTLNVFDYLPLTKAKQFARNKQPLLATTECHEITNGDYFAKNTLQLRLTPWYDSREDYRYGKASATAMRLTIDWFATGTNLQEPIFDKNGIPKIVPKTVYLKKDEIKAGSLYKDKEGREWLCLTGISLEVKTRYLDKNQEFLLEHHCFPGYGSIADNIYLKINDKIKNILLRTDTFTEFITEMAAIDTNQSWVKKLSIWEKPKRFVEKVQDCFSLSAKPSTIEGSMIKCKDEYDRYHGTYKMFVYHIK